MSNYIAATHANLKNDFVKQTKLVLKQNISTNPVKLKEYKQKIINAYNEYIEYLAPYFEHFDSTNREDLTNEINAQRDKLKRCYEALHIEKELPSQLLDSVDINELETFSSDSDSNLNEPSKKVDGEKTEVFEKLINPNNLTEQLTSTLPSNSTVNDQLEANRNNPNTLVSGSNDDSNNLIDINSSFQRNSQTNNTIMEQSAFISLCAKQLHNTYSGDPLELNAFINSIKLLKTLGPTHLEILKTFVLTKLGGKALESVPTDPADVDAIIDALRANIKPDNSKVVEGKMMALKLDNAKTSEFTKEAEKLAEALQRSLIVEGIPQAKAKSMAVEKTVEMCRQTAKSNLVRSVLASTSFTDPQEVVAKFVIESATDLKEKQIFKFSQQQNSNRGGNRNNNNFRGRGNQRNNQNRNFNQNNGQQWNNNFRGNRRGRGRGRGRYNNFGNNYGNNFNQNDRFSVRVANSENSQVPSNERRVQEGQIVTFQRVNQN